MTSKMFSVINDHLAAGSGAARGRGRRSSKKKKLAKLTGGRVQLDGKGGITLKGKRQKNISLGGLRKRKGTPGRDISTKKKQKLQFQPGQKVKLSHEKFAGQYAIVDKWLQRKQKYGLKLKGGKKISLDPQWLSLPAAVKKKKGLGALGGWKKSIVQEPQDTATTSSGARVTFSGGQITLNKKSAAALKSAAGRKRKQVEGGQLAATALQAVTSGSGAAVQRAAKRIKKTIQTTPSRPTVSVVKKPKKKKKKLPPKKRGLGPQIDHYQAKGGALILIRSLPKSVAGHHLIMDLFPTAGEILSSIVHTDASGKSTGSGEVHFAKLRDAQKAIEEHRGTVYGGNRISMTLIGTQLGGRMTSNITLTKEEVDSEDEYESEYEEEPAEAEPAPEEHKEEPEAEEDSQTSQAELEEAEVGEEPVEVDNDESWEDEQQDDAPAAENGLAYISPSESEDEEEDDGPEFHVTLKGGLGLTG